MFRFLAAGFCLLGMTFSSSNALAQLVRIGPYGHVSVRAPFVNVETSRWGGTYVRAPFTRVYTPPRYGVYVDPFHHYAYGNPYHYPPPPLVYESYRVPVIVPIDPYPPIYAPPVLAMPAYPEIEPRLEAASASHAASPDQLAARLRSAAARLSGSLSQRRDDADVWLDYLAPARIIEVIDRGDSPESLQQLLSNYDGVAGNRDLVSIVRADGYSDTRRLLRQFVVGPTPEPTRSVLDATPAARRPTPAAEQRETPKNAPTLAEPIEPAQGVLEAEAPAEPDVTSI